MGKRGRYGEKGLWKASYFGSNMFRCETKCGLPSTYCNLSSLETAEEQSGAMGDETGLQKRRLVWSEYF